MSQNDSSGSLIKLWPVLLDHFKMPSQREVTWLIEILNAANKLSSKGAVLIDADDMDNPTADLPDVHVEVDFKDVFTPLRVTCWRAPIPKDATVVVEIKNNAITN